jgi:chitinase
MTSKGAGKEKERDGARPSARLLAVSSAVSVLLAVAACKVSQTPAEPARPSKVIMGYYVSWKQSEFDHTKVPFEFLTHLAHAFVRPDPSGELVVPPGFLYPELNAAAHARGVKVLLSVGGGGNSGGFPGASGSAGNRARLIGRLVDFCRANAYDGVDLDWEFVSNAEERAAFTLLAEELAAALKAQSPPLLLTMAAPANHFHGRWIDFERLAGAFDLIGLMTYDYHGRWSAHSGHNAPLYAWPGDACGSLDEGLRYARGRGVGPGKILAGLAFYGRSFDCGGLGLPFTSSEYWPYADVMRLPEAEWELVWDGVAQVPYLRRRDGGRIISFDDMRSIALKCQYVKDQGAAGVIIWELSQDLRAGKSELLEIVGKSFGAR